MYNCPSYCDRVFTDKASGARLVRPGLDDALSHLRAGDTLVVWKLDRLGRSVKGLVDLVNALEARTDGTRCGFAIRGNLADDHCKPTPCQVEWKGSLALGRRRSKHGAPGRATPTRGSHVCIPVLWTERAKKLFLLGSYDPEGVRGLSLSVARDRAAELTALYRTGVLDLHGHFEPQRADQERERGSRRKRRSTLPWGICSIPTPPTWNSRGSHPPET